MKKKKKHGTANFLKSLAPHILAELRPPTEIKKFTKNSVVIGAYVESAVREFVRRQVFPLSVSTGSVIDEENEPGDPHLPQLDTIIWTPSPAPAVFQVGDFALVPRSSSFGILEIKSSAYKLRSLDDRLSNTFARRFAADVLRGEKSALRGFVPCLGVICLLMKNQSRKKITSMTNSGRVVILFEESGDEILPRPLDIYRLVNFLAHLRLRSRVHQGRVGINVDLLN